VRPARRDRPQILAAALNPHWRGSARMPSVTPSCASHAAMAAFTAAWCLAGVTVPPAMALFSHDFVCIVSARHPRIGARLGKARYCAEGHVVITSSTRSQSLVDKALAAQGLKRRVVMHVPTFLGVARIAAGTDLIVTTPRLLVQTLSRSDEVRLLPPPLPTYDVKQHWHERLHVDPASMWLRQAVAGVAAQAAPAGRAQRAAG
jgi:hypothetical protein